MFRVLTCLGGEHDPRLVLLAGGVCLLASIVAINLFRRATATAAGTRLIWLALAGAATGCGIWATHFIAMLAYEPGVAIAYDITLTVLSLCLAMLITGCGLSLAVYKPKGWYPAIGGMIVGGGVACMHYTGMLALELPGHIFGPQIWW
jgi:NO-binding membrane sensor protein with MHYT domain